MSTKTLLKRLALGTVVALGASVLTVSAANATDGDIASITGTGIVAPLAGSGTAQTLTVLATGSLVVATNGSTSDGTYVVSSGAAVTGKGGSGTINASQTQFTPAAASETFTVTPTGAGGSTFTITGYTTTAKSVVQSVVTVTIAASSVYGVVSAAKSYLSWVATSSTARGTKLDTASANSTTVGLPLALEIFLNDAYGNPVTTAGALTATTSSGANISLGISTTSVASATAGSYSTAVYASAPNVGTSSDVLAKITEATAGAGWSGTVSVSYNGVLIGTKSGTISGLPAKITVTPNIVVHTNTENYGAFSYQAYDAAGNIVAVPYGSLALSSSSNTAAVTAIAGKAVNSSTASGDGSITGGTTAGTSAVVIKYVNAAGATILSNSFKVNVGGAASSYTAKLDKSSYNQGDIATLTVQFLDSKGNPAASDSGLYTVSSSSAPYLWNASIAAPMLQQIGSTGSFSTSTATVVSTYATDEATYAAYLGVVPDTTGSITIKYTVGGTGTFAAGNYNTVVDFPRVDAVAGSAQTVAYTVGSQGTSLNDVLKGIVSLIASINKQIAALAKLVAPAKKK
jgi:hypothetical protein